MKFLALGLLVGSSLVGSSTAALAQTDTTAVVNQIIIDPVEKMPALWINGRAVNIATAVEQRLAYLPNATRVAGRVFVSFEVTAAGLVKDIRIAKGLRPDYDSATVQAVRQLPRFKPSEQLGQPVASRITVPVKFGKRTIR
jgi:TonB family protein